MYSQFEDIVDKHRNLTFLQEVEVEALLFEVICYQ